jgi:serine/threonine protein kinase
VNCEPETQEITEVQLADFGSTMSEETRYARDGEEVGTAIFRSPEIMLSMRWSTSTDIWSFGATVSCTPSPPFKQLCLTFLSFKLISLIYGNDFHVFDPEVPSDHEDFDAKILVKHHQIFGPFPSSYQEIADEERLGVMTMIMEQCSPDTMSPFALKDSKEVSDADKAFLLRIMKLDPRDRPTAQELLQDQWFRVEDQGNAPKLMESQLESVPLAHTDS